MMHASNRMGRILFESMEETLGAPPLRSILNESGLAHLDENLRAADSERVLPFETIGKLQRGLESTYGPQSGRGLALLIGRNCFKYGMREFAAKMGFAETGFRLLPHSMKLRAATKSLMNLIHSETDARINIQQSDEKLILQIEHCPVCWECRTNEPSCHLIVGLLQESMTWVSSGKIFKVNETLCIARGESTCTFEINLNPIA